MASKYPEMTEEELVTKIRGSLKRSDVERWNVGDMLVAQSWLTEERIEGIAAQLDVQPKTLNTYRDTAREFATDTWRNSGAPWGVLEKLRAVKSEKDRLGIFEEKDDPSMWKSASMATRVNEFQRKKRTEAANAKRVARGLLPIDESDENTKKKYLAEKTGCNIYGHPVHVNYSKTTREVTFEIEVPLEDLDVSTRGGVTRIVGIVPLPDVDDEEL